MADALREASDDASRHPASAMPLLRTATAADLPGLAAIYNEAVAHSVATFDVEPQPPAVRRARRQHPAGRPRARRGGVGPRGRHGVCRHLPSATGLRRHP